jgi:hypothetical protein
MVKRTEVIIVDELRAARVLQKGDPLDSVTAYKNLMSDYWYVPPGRLCPVR